METKQTNPPTVPSKSDEPLYDTRAPKGDSKGYTSTFHKSKGKY